jgi:hypothetical protein
MITALMIMPTVLPPLLGIIAIVIAYHTMLVIDKTRAAVQAHRRAFPSFPQLPCIGAPTELSEGQLRRSLTHWLTG